MKLEVTFWTGSGPISLQIATCYYANVSGSNMLRITYDVPQDSVLGPLSSLYMLMIYRVSQRLLNYIYLVMIQVFLLNPIT